MGEKSRKHGQNGKGSGIRPGADNEKYRENFDAIFRKKEVNINKQQEEKNESNTKTRKHKS